MHISFNEYANYVISEVCVLKVCISNFVHDDVFELVSEKKAYVWLTFVNIWMAKKFLNRVLYVPFLIKHIYACLNDEPWHASNLKLTHTYITYCFITPHHVYFVSFQFTYFDKLKIYGFRTFFEGCRIGTVFLRFSENKGVWREP